jgi:hypothetical protein
VVWGAGRYIGEVVACASHGGQQQLREELALPAPRSSKYCSCCAPLLVLLLLLLLCCCTVQLYRYRTGTRGTPYWLAPRTVPVLQACLAKTTGNLITKKTIEWGSGATYGRCNMHKRCVIVLIWCTVCPMSYDS